MASKPTIGWIGAGRMGTQLATLLLGAGYDLTAYNRTASKLQPLLDLGAKAVSSPADLADRDIVFSMVSASKDLESVLLGENGVLSGDKTPGVLADLSTVSMEVSAKVRAVVESRGGQFLATPVSGNPKVISAGKLTVAVSGPRAVFDEMKPVLDVLGRRVTWVGDGEVARLVKIAHNIMLGVVTQNLAEILVLVEKGGVKRSDFLSFFNDSVMGSVFTKYKSPALVNLDWGPTFTQVLLKKDFDLGLDAAHTLGVTMPITSATREIVAGEVGAGNVDDDFANLLLTVARNSGLVVEAENIEVDDGLAPKA